MPSPSQAFTTFRSGTDALLLAAYAWKHRPQEQTFVELGCGDGLATALLTKVLGQRGAVIRALGVDVQEQVLEQARARKKELEGHEVHWLAADMAQKKAFRAACAQLGFTTVSCVLANPPYYTQGRVSPHEARAMALHQDDDRILEVFCTAAKGLLEHHGWFFTIYAAQNMLDLLQALSAQGFGVRNILPVHTRPAKAARWVLVAARKGAAHDVQMEPGLCLYARKKGDAMSRAALSFCPWL